MHGGGWDDTGRKIHRTHSAWRSKENFFMRKIFKWKKIKFISTMASLNGRQDFGSFASSATTKLNNDTVQWDLCSNFIDMQFQHVVFSKERIMLLQFGFLLLKLRSFLVIQRTEGNFLVPL
jgi:hypothetical protein